MTNKIFKDEMLSAEQLENVAGGTVTDRALTMLWLKAIYDIKEGKNGKVVDFTFGSNFDVDSVMKRFCARGNIEYQMNENVDAQYKINGQWRDISWMLDNRQETFDFFDRKFGIK